MANSRGTEYSLGHVSLKNRPLDDAAYWNFTWADMAKYDIPAMITEVKRITEKKKLSYIGYSQGAGQMFTALADRDLKIKESLHKFIALSPCVMLNVTGKDEKFFEEGLYRFEEKGIYAYKGPDWEDDLTKICEEFDSEVCLEFTNHSTKEHVLGVEYQPTSMKNLRYWWQNGFMNRYQEYAPNYNEGKKLTRSIGIDDIGKGVSIAMFVPRNDEKCPFHPMSDIKVDHIRWYEGDEKHGHFSSFKDTEFIIELTEQLSKGRELQTESILDVLSGKRDFHDYFLGPDHSDIQRTKLNIVATTGAIDVISFIAFYFYRQSLQAEWAEKYPYDPY